MKINVDKNALNLLREKTPELAAVFAHTFEDVCNSLDFNMRCLDWYSYYPDFYIQNYKSKAA